MKPTTLEQAIRELDEAVADAAITAANWQRMYPTEAVALLRRFQAAYYESFLARVDGAR